MDLDFKVKKRNSTVAAFDSSKLQITLEKAFKEDRNRVRLSAQDKQTIETCVSNIVVTLQATKKKTFDVEVIQDTTETELMKLQEYSVAKKYILFREEKKRQDSLQEQMTQHAQTFKQLYINTQGLHVVKRDGSKEPIQFDKVLQRLVQAAKGLKVDPSLIAQKVIAGIYDGVSTIEIDNLAAEIAAVMTEHYHYQVLAARLLISNLHKITLGKFSVVMKQLHEKDYLADDVLAFIKENEDTINNAMDYKKDFQLTYFGTKTLLGNKDRPAYLMHTDGKILERPQDMFMRVACGVCCGDLEAALELYKNLSDGHYVHASPTLFNAGTKRPQMSSCFLQAMGDSIEGIYDTRKECAQISKWAGGIGLHVTNIRAKGSRIKGTNGKSEGLVPMLRTFNADVLYVNQGGKRKGSICVYIEPWHADIEDVLNLPLKNGKEEFRARDLNYALWIPDLFMNRVENDQEWSLFCPSVAKGLDNTVGEEFNKLYVSYEQQGLARKTIKARDLWLQILKTQMETGYPFLVYKDPSNLKSNQQNLGVIKSSNLCTEIIEYSDENETAVCNLASLCLATFVTKDNTFNFEKLHATTKVATLNLNRVIDRNWYPTEKTQRSNIRHRPIGLGMNGLADTFFKMDLAFDSAEAKALNRDIAETMYHAALEASMELAKKEGSYETFKGSPTSKGVLQFDLWNIKPSSRYDWIALANQVKEHGLRNSLLIAPMPTASTSQIMGWNECFEPITSNLYKRQTLAGEFVLVNNYLIEDLDRLGLWTKNLHDKIILENGSVQNIDSIPQNLKDKYKTVWEIPQKILIDYASDRGAFICQSQSLNLFVAQPSIGVLNSMHFYAWKKGLKTGCYYLRSKPASNAQKVTVTAEVKAPVAELEVLACSLENPEACVECSS